jgi:hypothetical protein
MSQLGENLSRRVLLMLQQKSCHILNNHTWREDDVRLLLPADSRDAVGITVARVARMANILQAKR